MAPDVVGAESRLPRDACVRRARAAIGAGAGPAHRARPGRRDGAERGAACTRRRPHPHHDDLAHPVRRQRHVHGHPQRAPPLPGARHRADVLQHRDYRRGPDLGRRKGAGIRGRDRRAASSPRAATRTAARQHDVAADLGVARRRRARGRAAHGPPRAGTRRVPPQFHHRDLFCVDRRYGRYLRDQLRLADRDDAHRPLRHGDLDGRVPAPRRAGRARGRS